jgi:hypothetical protein
MLNLCLGRVVAAIAKHSRMNSRQCVSAACTLCVFSPASKAGCNGTLRFYVSAPNWDGCAVSVHFIRAACGVPHHHSLLVTPHFGDRLKHCVVHGSGCLCPAAAEKSFQNKVLSTFISKGAVSSCRMGRLWPVLQQQLARKSRC